MQAHKHHLINMEQLTDKYNKLLEENEALRLKAIRDRENLDQDYTSKILGL